MLLSENTRRNKRYCELYEYGSWLSKRQDAIERDLEKAAAIKQKGEYRAKKLKELITFFNEFFKGNEKLLNLASTIFKVWERYQYNKEIPNALIQLEAILKKNGYEDEWRKWEIIAKERFSKK